MTKFVPFNISDQGLRLNPGFGLVLGHLLSALSCGLGVTLTPLKYLII